MIQIISKSTDESGFVLNINFDMNVTEYNDIMEQSLLLSSDGDKFSFYIDKIANMYGDIKCQILTAIIKEHCADRLMNSEYVVSSLNENDCVSVEINAQNRTSSIQINSK